MSEFKELFTDAVKVERFSEDTDNPRPSGMNTKKTTTVAESLDCSIQPIKVNMVNLENYTDITKYKDMYCDNTDLQEKDIVTNLANSKKYIVTEVNSVEDVLMVKLQSYKE
jgi:predicted RNA-binding protein with EMAP domain